ncbi:hypothetical protein K227x_23720 [Rubripirellula lacrimiformis]|uniref:BON domain-containing protein n=1 Tax=Rubripirellula lacrimiformis TaxID=1930273 RepID=A0A517NA19_9BACT|nr:BON domain-containing protein [Rubripirellula lacrimiformis]QDT03986.1 hypothetical protein K227x_23720 [Rubripirellula lacrimiformis]
MHMTISTNEAELELRVKRTLARLGFPLVAAHSPAAGQISLNGSVPSTDDRSLLTALTKTVPGVSSVVNETIIVKPAS